MTDEPDRPGGRRRIALRSDPPKPRKQRTSNGRVGRVPIPKVREALIRYCRSGSSQEASEVAGVAVATLQGWIVNTYPELYKEIRDEWVRIARVEHADAVRRAWANLADTARIAYCKIMDGDYQSAGEFGTLAGVIERYVRAGDTARRLDDGEPTSILEDRRSHHELLADIARRAERIGVVVELPPVQVSTTADRH